MNEQLLTTVEDVLARAGLLSNGSTLLVALSGGADSVALLHAVCALRGRHGFAVCAAHVEHGLRGESSQQDARFCASLCAGLQVPCTIDHANLGGGMDDAGVEARARQARYALLLGRARQAKASALLLAHHMDDQAETVLAHLIRGSGAKGLGGMHEVSLRDGVTLVRPLLGLSKQTLLAALEGLPYREDESNADLCCQRNRLRQEVLPLLHQENPRAAEHIAQSAALLTMDEDYLAQEASRLLQQALNAEPPFYCLHRSMIAAAPAAVAVRALRQFVWQGALRYGAALQGDKDSAMQTWHEQGLSAGDSLALLRLAGGVQPGTMNLPHDLRVGVTEHFVHLLRMQDGAPIQSSPGSPVLRFGKAPESLRFAGYTVRTVPYKPGNMPRPDGLRTVVVPDALLRDAVLRVPETGDRFYPFGTSGSKELRRYLTDRKLDTAFRACVPVLCIGRDVLWVAGLGAAETTRMTDVPSTMITLQGNLPWWI